MTKHEIVARIAEERRVEDIVSKVCKVSRVELDDLAQMIYEAMLLYDESKIVSLYEHGQLNYFIVRIVQNQFYSKTSQFYALFRKLSQRSIDVSSITTDFDERDNDCPI